MVREEKVETFYSKLRESALRATDDASVAPSPLLIFPSTSDVDSLCALKVIFHVLESDSIQYACYPVSSFNEVHKYLEASLSVCEDTPLTMLLINWGCHRDLRRLLDLPGLSGLIRVFVVDSHRPIHLHNLSQENEDVIVLYTKDDEQQADLSYDFDVWQLANVSDLNSDDEGDWDEGDDDDDDSDNESDSDDEDEVNRKKKRRVSDEGGDDDDDSDNESDSDDEDEANRKKKRRVSDEGGDGGEGDPLKLFRRFRRLKRRYYRMGTFHGKPSGVLMYDLSHSLRKNTNEQLWLACVSLTDQFVHERLTDERYQAGSMELEQHINSLGNLEAVTSVTLKDGTRIRAPDFSRIAYEKEPRLMLLREWNLFDSMLCSSYIATKLKTWSDNGMKKLKLLLARMGFALIDCQQKFQYMSIEVKRKMKDEFTRFLPEYGLSGLYYQSFLRLHGYSSKVSAADVVFGVTALLESFVNSDGSCASRQFGVAYDALSLNNLDQLRTGMQNAIKVQRAILRQGSTAITRRGSIRSGRKFRWVKLEDSADTKLLGYPQALTKFCFFVMDALREKGAVMKPLLCACLAQEQDKVLIVGVTAKPTLGASQGNAFGMAFKNAAREIGAEYFHELFESSWIILDKVAVNSFMVKLTERLQTFKLIRNHRLTKGFSTV